MVKDNEVYLKLILDSIRKVKEFIGGINFDDFIKDSKTQSAVIMQLHVIGELAKKISDDIKSQTNLPWRKISGMRDMISHEYFGLDLEQVWKAVKEDILELESEVNKYMDKVG